MGKVWVAVITKYEKKQAILVDFHFFSHEDDYNFAYHFIVTTADPLYGPDFAGEGGWKYEGTINNMVSKFIESLPKR